MLVIDTDKTTARSLAVSKPAERYTLSVASSDLQTRAVQLNGTDLALAANDALPVLAGAQTAGRQRLVRAGDNHVPCDAGRR